VANIGRLRHEEGVRLDSDCLMALYVELGQTAAEQAISHAMEELAVLLAGIKKMACQNDTEQLISELTKLSDLAGRVGMTSLAQVGNDVARCAAGGDIPAQAATLARLIRIGDRSLTAVWDLQDMSL